MIIQISDLEKIIKPLGFSDFQQVTNRASVSDLFRSGTVPGLYVLGFKDGSFYAGKTNNIKVRFIAHQKSHKDIEFLAFKDLPIHLQDEEEKPLVQNLKNQGFLLRNIQFISYPDTVREFDEIIGIAEQKIWIEGKSIPDRSERNEEPEQRYRYSKKFQALKNENIFELLAHYLKLYTSTGLPQAKKTERCYWCVSVWPTPSSYVGKKTKREYARVNIGGCEVLTIGKDCVFPDCRPGYFLAMHTAISPLQDGKTSAKQYIQENFPNVVISDHKYDSMGEDQILLIANSFETGFELLKDDRIKRAIRLGNIGLMRKRACLYSQNHCYDMADYMV